MLVGRNVQELDKPPHQEQQAGPGYMTLGDVMSSSLRELSCLCACHLLQESAGAPKDRRFLISMKTSQMS